MIRKPKLQRGDRLRLNQLRFNFKKAVMEATLLHISVFNGTFKPKSNISVTGGEHK